MSTATHVHSSLPAAPGGAAEDSLPAVSTVILRPAAGPFHFRESRMSEAAQAALRAFADLPPFRGATAKTFAAKLAPLKQHAALALLDAQTKDAVNPCLRRETMLPDPWNSGTQRMLTYQFADGSLVRYKEKGDIYASPDPACPVATFTIEVAVALDGAGGKTGETAFCVDRAGHAVPRQAAHLAPRLPNADATPATLGAADQRQAAMQAVYREAVG